MYVIAMGNPFDGMTLYGPFQTHQEALEEAEQSADGIEWYVARLESPKALRENAL